MIHSPVLIIGCPRSGTTLLFNLLSEVPDLWSIGYESKAIIEHYHHPRVKDWESGILEANDLTAESRDFMLTEFERQAAPGNYWQKVNRLRAWLRSNALYQGLKRRGKTQSSGSAMSSTMPQQGLEAVRVLARLRNRILPQRGSRRLLEKTPENCLRLPFLEALFPDMRVIYLIRDGRANVNSLMEGWRQPHTFPGYLVPGGVQIPGDRRGRWAFTLIPGWQELRARPLAEVCAWQWVRCNEAVLAHREKGTVPYLTVRYEEFVRTPQVQLPIVLDFIGAEQGGSLQQYFEALPLINTVSQPDLEKWRGKNREAIEGVRKILAPMMERLGYAS